MTPEPAILLSLFIPLVGAVLIALSDRWPNVREGVTLVTATLLFLVVSSLVPTVFAGGRPEAILIEMLPAGSRRTRGARGAAVHADPRLGVDRR